MYSKGSNTIPMHVLPELETTEITDWLLLSAKQTHTNILRIWGGGTYYNDYFYDVINSSNVLGLHSLKKLMQAMISRELMKWES
jgi:beta-mannosidase